MVELFFSNFDVTPIGGSQCSGKRWRTMVKAKVHDVYFTTEILLREVVACRVASFEDESPLAIQNWCWESHCHACGIAKQTVKDISVRLTYNHDSGIFVCIRMLNGKINIYIMRLTMYYACHSCL